MPRFNVKHLDTGKWRCFSTIIDDWITEWMDKKSYEEWRKQQYRIINYLPAEQCNMMTLDEAEKIRIRQMYQETESES